MLRKFKVSAIELPIVYNRYGDVDPNGLMYVLEENEKLVTCMYLFPYDTGIVKVGF